MTKRSDYWETETFPLVDNRHVVGKVVPGRKPYERTMPVPKQALLEIEARKEAPPRHCLTCGKVLSKRVRVQINGQTDEVEMGSIEYGYRGKGYWDTLKCMRQSAPKLAAALIRIRNTPFAGKAFSRETHGIFHGIRQVALQALNHFQHNFN